MVQTLAIRSDGTAEVNTGNTFWKWDGLPLTEALQGKLDAILALITSTGVSALHVERDTFRQFEHATIANRVEERPFGATVSVADFEWIMQHLDVEVPMAQAAQMAAEEAANTAVLENPA